MDGAGRNDILDRVIPGRYTQQALATTERAAQAVTPASRDHSDQSARAKLARLFSFHHPIAVQQRDSEEEDDVQEGIAPEPAVPATLAVPKERLFPLYHEA
jgi:hypothetical protein